MKNIHVLPTEKKSVLIYTALAGYQMATPQFTKSDLELIQAHYENIYITSDEEIKEGDWVIYQKFMFPLKVILDQDGYHIVNNGIGEVVGDYYSLQERYKKIILTTDQDLIKDGVQAIDDEFIEWFVKNPSCERVEIEKILLGKVEGTTMTISKYKIIIIKEEPKQETLEEAALKLYPIDFIVDYDVNKKERDTWLKGAKWQQEQMYNEEEVKKIALDFFYHWRNAKGTNTEQGFNKWFEQFKSK